MEKIVSFWLFQSIAGDLQVNPKMEKFSFQVHQANDHYSFPIRFFIISNNNQVEVSQCVKTLNERIDDFLLVLYRRGMAVEKGGVRQWKRKIKKNPMISKY